MRNYLSTLFIFDKMHKLDQKKSDRASKMFSFKTY